MRKVAWMVLGSLAIAVAPAVAQDKPVEVNIGFGWIFPITSGLKNDFNAGWTGTIGATFWVNPKVGIMAEYTYDHMNGPDKTVLLSPGPGLPAVNNGLIQSNHQIHSGIFNVVFRPVPHPQGGVNGYILVGGGIYHRIINLTTPSAGYTTICDPYWYVCYPALVPIDVIIGSRSSNDFGFDVGGGIEFGHEAKFYIESRYTYVWGPTVTVPAAVQPYAAGSYGTSATYIPLTFGVRF
jgi:opacity protein-like surface antigen